MKVSEAGEGRLSDADFWRETPDEYAATTWFQNLYWPDGVRCPTCVGCDVQTIDDGGLQSHRCNRCQRDFSLTTETLMEGLAIPLLEWRQALLIMTGGSTLGSVPELSRRIGWDVATAREATRRLLLATIEPVRPLREPAELDWTWVDHPRAEGYRGKSLAIAVIGRASHRVAGLRTIPREREREVHRFVGEHLAPGMTLFVDTHASNRDIPDAIKYFVDHHRKQYACGPASTNLPEGLWQRIKRTLHTDYDWYFNDNLDLWLAGLQWRENQRDLKPRERMMALAMAMRWKAPTQVRDRTDRHEQLELGSTFDHRCDDCENADCLADRHQRWGRGCLGPTPPGHGAPPDGTRRYGIMPLQAHGPSHPARPKTGWSSATPLRYGRRTDVVIREENGTVGRHHRRPMTTYPKTIEETDMDTNNHEHKQHGDFAKVKPSRVARRPLAAGSTLYGFRRLALPGAEDAPVTDLQLRDETPDEASAERWFRTIYWPPGVNMRCPRCSWNEPSKSLRDKSALPYRCLRCRKTFSVKTNTVMHRSRLTLVQWKQALHIWTGGDRPCSSKELGSRIGVDDGTARDITQRLLKAAQEDIPPLREPSELAPVPPGRQAQIQAQGPAPPISGDRNRHGGTPFRTDHHQEGFKRGQGHLSGFHRRAFHSWDASLPEQSPDPSGHSQRDSTLPVAPGIVISTPESEANDTHHMGYRVPGDR